MGSEGRHSDRMSPRGLLLLTLLISVNSKRVTDVVCGTTEARRMMLVTLGEGDSYTFNTQPGIWYRPGENCIAIYRRSPSSECRLHFSCPTFSISNTRKPCSYYEDYFRIDYTLFCQEQGPDIWTDRTRLKVIFRSNQSSPGGAGAHCTVSCLSKTTTEARATTTTTARITTKSSTTPSVFMTYETSTTSMSPNMWEDTTTTVITTTKAPSTSKSVVTTMAKTTTTTTTTTSTTTTTTTSTNIKVTTSSKGNFSTNGTSSDTDSTCVSTGAWAGDSSMTSWCLDNCLGPVPYCPKDRCDCEQTVSHYTSSCQAIGVWAGNHEMDTWCYTNCNHSIPHCPTFMCVCHP